MNWHWNALIVCGIAAFIWLRVGLRAPRDTKLFGLDARRTHFAFAAVILVTGLIVFVRD